MCYRVCNARTKVVLLNIISTIINTRLAAPLFHEAEHDDKEFAPVGTLSDFFDEIRKEYRNPLRLTLIYSAHINGINKPSPS